MNNKEVDMFISSRGKGKGGFLACMFVFVLGTFENIGFVAYMVAMVLYFKIVMQFDLSASSNTLTNFMGSVWLLSLLGGFISDKFLNRLQTCLTFRTFEILGLIMLTTQAYSKSLHPDPCGKSSCVKGGKAAMFSLCLLAVGSGGVKGSLPALGADQFDRKDQKGEKLLASYFNWYLHSTTIGSMVGVTVVVWVSMNRDWYWGFLIGTITAVVGFVFLTIGKPFYWYQPLGSSPIVKIAQVIVAAIRNRRLPIPTSPASGQLYEIDDEDRDPSEEKISHTSQFRSLNKANILLEGMTPNPWKVCTVTQVEEVKILTRLLPIIGSTIIMNTCMAQLQTFPVHQGYFIYPYICSFKFPTSSIPVKPLFFMSLLIPIYEFLMVPFAWKITGHPSGITQLQRVGVGLVLSIISMAVAAIVEVKRMNHAHENPSQPLSRLFWLSFQYGIFGIADMFTIVGLMEFFYKEAPSGMRSLSTSFTFLSLSFGYFLSSIFMDLINSITKKITPSKQGWLHGNNLNDNHLDLFYWFLAILSTLNFAIYLYCTSWYKYKKDNTAEVGIKYKKQYGDK